jgi:gamma-glutamyl-gamma-aminobutyrate hydrolase PuuD
MPVPTKRIREHVTEINDAWAQGAPTAVFSGIAQTQFDAKIKAAAGADQEIDELEAALNLKKQFRDGLYEALNDDAVKIHLGVQGHPEFGKDHPILDPMGFVRDSQKKTGLTRRKKEPKPPTT